MTDEIDQAAVIVKPLRRDKLSRLGDKLDAAEAANDDAWTALFFAYEPQVMARALASKLPKVKIKSTADLWAADALWFTLWDREKAIKADIAANSAKASRRMRTAADLKALLAVAERDGRIVAAAIRQYKADKEAGKQRAITIAKQRRERVRGIAKAIHSAIGRAAS